MKKPLLSIPGIILLFLVTFTTTSCKKEGLVSKELLVFLSGDKAGTPTNTRTVPFIHTPIGIEGNTIIDVSAYATREVPADITIYINPSVGLINEYNQKNNTNLLELPFATYNMITPNKQVMPAGTMESAPIQIEIIHPELLTNPNGYILPLTLTKIESNDKGVKISTTHATMYLKITYEFSNVVQTETPLSSTLMSRTGWSVTVSNSSSGTANQASNMLDGSNSTVWRSSNSSTAAKTVTLNMGSVQQVSGFRISPNYNNTNENAVQMTISTSTDNVNYTFQGIWRGKGPAAGTNATNPDYKGVTFVVPVQARYWRFDITAWVASTVNVVGIAEINGIQ